MQKKKKDDTRGSDIGEVSAIGVFVDHQMILKVFPEQAITGAFRAANKNFKSECLSFLKQVEEKDHLEVRHYEISDAYTMFYSEVGDKEVVFLMAGDHPNGFPSTDALNQAAKGIIASIHQGNTSESGGSKKAKGHKRQASRLNSLVGFSSIEEVFRTMDLDGNGSIDDAEIKTGLGVLGCDWKDSKIKKVFNSIDEEDAGEISLDAFMRFMSKATNKSSWKELKSAINASITVPPQKSIKESSISPEQYQKKLSQMEKVVNMMEESVVEAQLMSERQQFWKHKILAHREFIRAHQDAVGKAMGSDNTKLKKKLNDLEKKNRRLSEFAVSMGIDPEDDRALKKKAKAKVKKGAKRSGVDEDKDEGFDWIIERLCGDAEERRLAGVRADAEQDAR